MEKKHTYTRNKVYKSDDRTLLPLSRFNIVGEKMDMLSFVKDVL